MKGLQPSGKAPLSLQLPQEGSAVTRGCILAAQTSPPQRRLKIIHLRTLLAWSCHSDPYAPGLLPTYSRTLRSWEVAAPFRAHLLFQPHLSATA